MQLSTIHLLSQKQSLVITAQLQQAIRLLQFSNHDLQTFIEEQAEENPYIEMRVPALPSAQGGGDDFDRIAALAACDDPSLYAHATAQIDRLELSAQERVQAETFLDALEPSGWLGAPIEVIARDAAISVDEAEALLARLHTVEPAGLFARNLAECLRLQAADQDILTPLFSAVLDNLPLLANADMRGLARACDTDLDTLRPVLRQLRGLNPKPGAVFDGPVSTQRPPDLIVTGNVDGWAVDLNRSTLPSVHIHSRDALPMRQSVEHKAYTEDRINVARWLKRAVDHRNHTILAVGAEVMKRQTAFLEHGPARMRPMVLREIADAIGVHESTVSRVTSGMLIQTPQGTLPLKAFFNAALGRKDQDAGSSSAVRHKIKALIAAVPAHSPLSDDAIVKLMEKQGVKLARRTVAKYRDMMNIPGSVQRRRHAVLAGTC